MTRLLLLSPDASKDVLRVVRTVAPAATFAASLAEVDAAAAWDLVVVDYAALPVADRAAALTRFSAGHVLVQMGAEEKDDLATLFDRYGLTNILAKSGELEAEDLLVTLQKILRGDVFGTDKYFGWAAETATMTATKASDRHAIIDAAAVFAERAGAAGRFVEAFRGACDELVTNALYDAAVDEHGARRFAHRRRTEEVELAAGEEVVVRFCADGRRVGIGVVDPFGSLDASTVVRYLGKCFRRGQDQVDEKEGGAGLGLYYVLEGLSQFVVNVDAGKRTEVIGLLDVRHRYKDFASKAKSFNVFVQSSPRERT
jgi:hypothetical protein